jgi:3-oxoacyl-[acyl-carrier-protein] synthase I
VTRDAPVWVAGTGVITAIGADKATCLASLQHSQAGIGPMERLTSAHRDTLPVAEVKWSNEALSARTDD